MKALYNALSKILLQRYLIRNTNIIKPRLLFQNVYSRNIPALNNRTVSTKKTIQKTESKGKTRKKEKMGMKIVKVVSASLGMSFVCLGTSLILVLGVPEEDQDGKPIKDDLFDEHIIKQYIIRTYRELQFYLKLIQVPLNEKLLPDPLEYPYLQPKYVLVLELTDVLIHSEWKLTGGWKFKKRPLLDYFLQTLKDSYEIIIYTAEQGKIVFPLTDAIDPKNAIAYKLERGATHFTGTSHVKKLDNLNRDLSKVICVDWNAKSVKFNPENLLRVKRWVGNEDDTSLLDLATFLKAIVDNDIEDVREVLKYYSKYEDPIAAFRQKQEKLIEELEEEAATKKVNHPFKITSRFRL